MRKAKQKFELGNELDMCKAYDQVEWNFLEAIMRKIGFNDQCLSLVMTCVSMVDFVVLVNGQSCRHFSLFRGFRQGDPLSLYMFLIISDVFPRSIQCVVEEGSIKGMQFNH